MTQPSRSAAVTGTVPHSATTATETVPPRRRQALGALGALGALTLAACGGGGGDRAAASSSSGGSSTAAASTNANLAGLSLSASGLTPEFSGSITSYALAVAHSVASLTLLPTTADSGAVVRVNGTVVASGSSSAAVALVVGVNTLSVVVTAADGNTSRSFTIVVTRAAAVLSADTSLAALVLSAGTLSPAFAAANTSYTVAVDNAVGSLSLTPVATSSAATITVNGTLVASGQASPAITLAVGSTTVTVVVTAEDGSTRRTITLGINRAAASLSSDATLSGLLLSAGTLAPVFSSGISAYTATVDNSVATLTVSATTSHAGATLRINGVVVASGAASAAITLVVGPNSIPVSVTAADGVTVWQATVTVTRAAASASTDASLSALTLSQGSLSPAFSATTISYTVAVANSVASLTLSPVATSGSATVKVNNASVLSGGTSPGVGLAVGSTTVTVVVTAQDGVTTRTYTLLVTRAAAGSCTLTPTETQGPFPLLAILSNTAMVRSDVREGKTGVPLNLTLTIQDLSAGCTPVAGAAVYIWHCDKDGLYSGYNVSNNAGQTGQTYLRGIQVTDANGQVHFTTVYPGWYAGRITHIHVQVYLNNNLQVTATATTQLAFPLATTSAVYASAPYTKGQNSSVTSFAADNVFSDGTTYEMVAISGSPSAGYDASLTITIA